MSRHAISRHRTSSHRSCGRRVLLGVVALLFCHSVQGEESGADPSDPKTLWPAILELRILDESRVFLRAEKNWALDRRTADGGIYDDHHYIEAATGKIKLTENARPHHEIVLEIGEGASDQQTSMYLKHIAGDVAVFRYSTVRRGGRLIDRLVSMRPYGEHDEPSDAALPDPATLLFRTDWRQGLRGEVTEGLVARLEIGMTTDQVAEILERPFRDGDEAVTAVTSGATETWSFTISLARRVELTFVDDRLTRIDGG